MTVGAAADGGGGRASVQGFTHYPFMVLGSGDAPVTIDASGGVGFDHFQVGGTGSTDLQFYVQEAGNASLVFGADLFLDASPAGCVDEANPTVIAPTCSFGFAINRDFQLHTKTTYNVVMNTSASVSAGNGPGTNSAFANIDPMFTVHGPFTIELSKGFGGRINLPAGGAIPEPASWAILLLGFGGLGAVLRRRRAAVSVAAA